MKKVTKRQAEGAYRAICKAYGLKPGDPDGPQLIQDYPGWYQYYPWAIVWETGPFEWALLTGGGLDEELYENLYPEFVSDQVTALKKATRQPIKMPKDVYVEALNGYSVVPCRSDW